MKKFLIADDHCVVREGLKEILSGEFNEAEFGEAGTGAEVLQKIKEKKWDLLILDVNMPGRSGLEVLRQLKDDQTTIPTLVFSMHPEEHIAIRALQLGAFGYISKDTANAELLRAIHQILSGKKYITPALAEQLVEQLDNPAGIIPHKHLSDREYQTFILIASGKTVSQIAKELSLSVPAISTYRARILQKMFLKNNSELMGYAIRNNLI